MNKVSFIEKLCIHESDIGKITMRKQYGSYEFIVMPFRLCKAPLVYSKDLGSHTKHVEIVLEKLRQNKLAINKEKSVFVVLQIDFLDHILAEDEISLIQQNWTWCQSGYALLPKEACVAFWVWQPTTWSQWKIFLKLQHLY